MQLLFLLYQMEIILQCLRLYSKLSTTSIALNKKTQADLRRCQLSEREFVNSRKAVPMLAALSHLARCLWRYQVFWRYITWSEQRIIVLTGTETWQLFSSYVCNAKKIKSCLILHRME